MDRTEIPLLCLAHRQLVQLFQAIFLQLIITSYNEGHYVLSDEISFRSKKNFHFSCSSALLSNPLVIHSRLLQEKEKTLILAVDATHVEVALPDIS